MGVQVIDEGIAQVGEEGVLPLGFFPKQFFSAGKPSFVFEFACDFGGMVGIIVIRGGEDESVVQVLPVVVVSGQGEVKLREFEVAPVVDDERFPVVVHDAGGLLRGVEPVSEPVPEGTGADGGPEFGSQEGGLSVGGLEPGAVRFCLFRDQSFLRRKGEGDVRVAGVEGAVIVRGGFKLVGTEGDVDGVDVRVEFAALVDDSVIAEALEAGGYPVRDGGPGVGRAVFDIFFQDVDPCLRGEVVLAPGEEASLLRRVPGFPGGGFKRGEDFSCDAVRTEGVFHVQVTGVDARFRVVRVPVPGSDGKIQF